MASKYLRTAQIAKAVGVHPNTVRLYEEFGFLSPIPRSATGYRLFTRLHLEQMRLARLALEWPYPGSRAGVEALVRCAVGDDLGMAMEWAYQNLAHVRVERTHAEAAVEFLERWALGHLLDTTTGQYQIGEAAARLGVTVDMLRNWERDGLIDVPRDPMSHYRLYGAAELGRLRVIRMLRQAGYSLMAILRMLRQFDAGKRENLRHALDTPRADEDIRWAADQWLTTLAAQEERAHAVIRQVALLIEMTIHGEQNGK
jgi:DNA-binding transcriptional MerR regulator